MDRLANLGGVDRSLVDFEETDPLLATLDIFELHGVEAPHLLLLLEVQLVALLVTLVEVLSVSVCVVVLKVAPPPLDWWPRALVRSIAVLGDYHEARLPPQTSISAKVGSWEVMAPLPALVVGLMKAAPLLRMLPMRLAPIGSQDALVSPREIAPIDLRKESLVTREEKAQAQHLDPV